jgi:hypothetical protein
LHEFIALAAMRRFGPAFRLGISAGFSRVYGEPPAQNDDLLIHREECRLGSPQVDNQKRRFEAKLPRSRGIRAQTSALPTALRIRIR